MRKIYVATSWRNPYHKVVVDLLTSAGYWVYDFKNPPNGKPFKSWDQINPDWVSWSMYDYRKALDHPVAIASFCNDFKAMMNCDECLLLCPSGRSAHLEAGFFVGAGKPATALIIDKQEPELMYSCLNEIMIGWDEFKSRYNV